MTRRRWYLAAPIALVVIVGALTLVSFGGGDQLISGWRSGVQLVAFLWGLPTLIVLAAWTIWARGKSTRALGNGLFALPLGVAALSWVPYVLFTDAVYRRELLHGWLFSAVVSLAIGLALVLAVRAIGWFFPK